MLCLKGGVNMPEQTGKNVYDDGNIPQVDLPSNGKSKDTTYPVEPLPESARPRKDGPGGD